MAGDTQTRTPLDHAKALMEIMDMHTKSMPTPTGLHEYQPRPTDTIITTFVKAGTTLLQNLTYHLAYLTTIAPHSSVPPLDTFTDISVVCPWIDYMPEFDLKYPSADPRIFKTHATFQTFAHFHEDPFSAPRHIVVIRSPFSFPPSFLDFLFDDLAGHVPESRERAVREAVFHAFVRKHLTSADESVSHWSWFKHARDWTTPLRPNILVLFYEDVVRDVHAVTRAIASFMQLEKARVTDEVVGKVAKACERGTMLSDTRFQCGVEAKGFNHGKTWKVFPENRDDSFKQFAYTDEEIASVNKRFESVLGYSSYEEFKVATKKAQAEKFGR